MPLGSKADYLENKVLDHVLGGGDYTRPATVYLALFTTLPADDGTGGTEASGGAYARVAITNNTTNFPAASAGSKASGVTFTFPTATGDWSSGAKMLGWGLYDASSSGNLLYWGHLVGTPKVVEAVNTSTDVLTITAHGYANGQRLLAMADQGALPGGLSENTTYYVVGQTTNTFQLSATSGGSAIDLTSVGYGLVRVAADYTQAVLSGNTVSIPSGQLVITED